MKNIILMPTYNEKENVKIIIPQIFLLLPDVNILIIDDNSPDKTADIVKDLMKSYPGLAILERAQKTGLGNAYKDAIKKLVNNKEINCIITMDADGSHDPGHLKDLLDCANKYDLLIGSRYILGGGIENWELWRKKLSQFGNLYAKILTGLKINDFTTGFMCIKREALEKINFDQISSSGYSFLIELKFYLIYKLKLKFKEVPIIFRNRREGESKISNQIISEGMIAPWRLLMQRFKVK